ncbi:short-chain dehydrogenase [Xylanimonas oleitrophica]|uniref:Short-chain dehydrogenase n=1 Tax=Xylanimonas oleitrophica TaxID=2607479 RepID=A0A2W5WVC4_9MICO|nr:SDR family oxidoreductase [Xylanimonas oleitrophica]PZR52226.1 short-chain dehydrogenase [Xylanimonas oleitrophica]
MEITNQIALVTGGNRGLGRHLVTELLARGASKVYAAARRPESVDVPGAVPLRLDVTDDASVEQAAAEASDVTLLVNNAGFSSLGSYTGGDIEAIRHEMEVNYWGTLRTVRAFAPILGANGGGAILNVLSQTAFRAFGLADAYGASKAAAWHLTNGVRLELAAQGTQVTGLAMGLVDTDMAAWAKPEDGWSLTDPAVMARTALDGVEAGAFEVYGDEMTREWHARLGEPAESLYPQALRPAAPQD